MQAKTTRAQLSKREAMAIGAALIGIFIAVDVYVSMQKKVWFFNGASSAYDVVIDGGKTMHLDPNVPQAVAIGLGKHTLTATVDGQTREVSFSSGIPALVAAFDVQVHVVNLVHRRGDTQGVAFC
jgi:hypothetical protein